MADRERVADMNPRELKSAMQWAVFVGVIAAHVVTGAIAYFALAVLR